MQLATHHLNDLGTPEPAQWLDRLARPGIRLFGKTRPSFQVCGVAGLCLAVFMSLVLVERRGLSPWILAAIAVAAVSTFLSLAMLTKIVTGAETLVYYHHEIAVISVAAVLLSVLHRPVLPYLDVTALGLGLFLACGRIGCFMVGCCHGRPHRLGVQYTPAHAHAGFTACYVGARLLPVQLFESLWVLAVTSIGIVLLWNGARPGDRPHCGPGGNPQTTRPPPANHRPPDPERIVGGGRDFGLYHADHRVRQSRQLPRSDAGLSKQIGRASCRERV